MELEEGKGVKKNRAMIVIDIIKVAILFIACTILFYYAIQWIHSEYEDMHRYDRPKGSMLKVDVKNNGTLAQLVRFYQNGE